MIGFRPGEKVMEIIDEKAHAIALVFRSLCIVNISHERNLDVEILQPKVIQLII